MQAKVAEKFRHMHALRLVQAATLLQVRQRDPVVLGIPPDHGDGAEAKDEELSKIERRFTEKVKDLSKKAAVIDVIQKESDFISVYNEIVDLFNHYVKKQELSSKIRGL